MSLFFVMQQTEIRNKIKQLALEAGFSDCGIAPAAPLNEDAKRLREWLSKEMHAGMQYMQNHFELRTDPSILVPGAKSVIVLLMNYYPEHEIPSDEYQIARYAYGRDYHKVIRKMLRQLKRSIEEHIRPLEGRYFVDSAPVLERSLAALAGLGWIGKNANLISPRIGSYVFIAELITDLELPPDKPIPDYCGGCTKCIHACPTGAILDNKVIDSNRCISYWTIEHKGAIDPELHGKFKDRIFGCDICQEVCPWNRKAVPHKSELLMPSSDLLGMVKNDWHSLTRERFEKLFGHSAVKRAGFEGIVRNIEFVGKD